MAKYDTSKDGRRDANQGLGPKNDPNWTADQKKQYDADYQRRLREQQNE